MINTRAKGNRAALKIRDRYKEKGYNCFKPREGRFDPKLPFGDLMLWNRYEVILVEAKATRTGGGWTLKGLAEKADAMTSYAFEYEICLYDGGKYKRWRYDRATEQFEPKK